MYLASKDAIEQLQRRLRLLHGIITLVYGVPLSFTGYTFVPRVDEAVVPLKSWTPTPLIIFSRAPNSKELKFEPYLMDVQMVPLSAGAGASKSEQEEDE
jgi:hypothetical protein